MRSFDLYQPVRVLCTRAGKEKWIPGTIVSIKGPRTYLVRVPGNNRRFVHSDHLIPDGTRNREQADDEQSATPAFETPLVRLPTPTMVNIPSQVDQHDPNQPGVDVEPPEVPPEVAHPPVVVTRSGRHVKAPNRLTY